MAATATEAKPWEQMQGESGPAYAAFLVYREMGAKRTFVGAARLVGKRESLLRRWAGRYHWRERVWRSDREQARQDEKVVRQHRAAVLSERLDDLDRMGLACLAFFRTMVKRDPATGEVTFDPRFTPQVALRFLELTLKAQGAFDRSAPDDKSDDRPAAGLFGLADSELMELIELARERAGQQDPTQETDDESHQGSSQKQHREDDEQAEDN